MHWILQTNIYAKYGGMNMNQLDTKLLKKCINYLLDGHTLHIEGNEYKYFRKDDEIHDEETQSFKVLENGIFCNHVVNIMGCPTIVRWIKVAELDQVNLLYVNFKSNEKEALLMNMVFTMD